MPARWSRLLLPSAADLIFVVLLLSLCIGILAPRLLGDAGIGWHIRTGELILQNHAITRSDPFSASVAGRPWYAWEWLYDIGIAVVHHHLGLNGVIFVTAVVISFTFALLLRLSVDAGANLALAVLFTALAASASTIHFFARPHVLSWLLTIVWFYLLDSSETAHRLQRLYCLPLLMLLWVNLHGGFVVGFVLLGIYFLANLFRRSLPSCKTLALVGVLCLASSFINPYGYHLHSHVYGYLTDRFLMNHIDEFLSPNFHGVAQQCFALLLLAAMLAVAVRREKISATHLMVLLFAAYSGLFASRNLPVSSILITLIAAPVLSRAFAQLDASSFLRRWQAFSARMTKMERASHGHIWPALISIALLCACWQGRSIHASFDAGRFPVQGVDYIAQRHIAGPIFCPDFWGGYLIYRLYPQNKVIVDDRHDLYGDDFLKKYLKAIRVEPGWNELLEEQRVKWALIPAGSPLAAVLQISGDWSIRSKDDVGILFERSRN